jgi:phage terminase large subunit
VFVDEGGLGAGVVDRLRQTGHNVMGVNFGARALNPRYKNKRAEMWDLMRQWLTEGGVLPNLPSIKADLSAPTFSFDAANRLKMESKADIKKRLGRSPDLADALALTFTMPVQTRQLATLTGAGRIRSDRAAHEKHYQRRLHGIRDSRL